MNYGKGGQNYLYEVFMEYGTCTDNYFHTKSIGNKNTIMQGYATVYVITDFENDIISPSAIKSLDISKIKLLWQHDPKKPIGKINQLFSDHYGLRIEAEINNDIEQGREASSLIKQGAVDGLSIGFTTEKSSINSNGVRVIEELKLYEVSVVTFPANSMAQIDSIKSQKNIVSKNLQTNLQALREHEDQLQVIAKLVSQF